MSRMASSLQSLSVSEEQLFYLEQLWIQKAVQGFFKIVN